ncbi:MAG TPA: hypothetical protein PLT45_04865 [Smithella sp.]|nr:hypothetical protein [Smithella sp.]
MSRLAITHIALCLNFQENFPVVSRVGWGSSDIQKRKHKNDHVSRRVSGCKNFEGGAILFAQEN